MSGRTDNEPVLVVQVDVDTPKHLLAFYGFHNSGVPEDHSEVYRLALPRFAELFKDAGICATFFVVGEDLGYEISVNVIHQLSKEGHEIANHTQTHDYNFIHLSHQEKRNEIERAGHAIQKVTGHKPVGFRAPGYAVDCEILKILAELGYKYDSSIMPSLLNIPLKFAHAIKSKRWKLSGYGKMAMCWAPNYPYHPDLKRIWCSTPAGVFWEIPVSCVPYLRLPFYSNFNLFSGNSLFQLSLALAAGRYCNYVFHAIEMLDPEEIPTPIRRHPNARLPLEQKIFRCRRFLQDLKKGRRVLLSREFAAELGRRRE